MVPHMKTTLELPDELLAAAKATALRRRTTLKALFTKALERELQAGAESPARFALDESGWPVLRREERSRTVVTEAFIEGLREREGV